MHWVKAIRIKHVCDNDPKWPTYIRHIEYRLRSDGAMYYQCAKEAWAEDLSGYMDDAFGRWISEPIHSPKFTEQDFLEEVSRQAAKFSAEPVFVKNEEELNASL